MIFTSDNASGVAPEILEALTAVNGGTEGAYGADAATARAVDRLREIFECPPLEAFLLTTGSAANALALSVLCPPYGAVLCHEASHIQCDECGAPEFFTNGAKLVALTGEAAKLTPDTVRKALAYLPAGVVHHVQARVLSLTQSTECGTLYRPEEIRALCDTAHGAGLRVHMDGARFANALVRLGCAPADITWRAGVDVLVLGATKNGAMAAEAVLFFNPDLAGDFAFRRKRGGHLISKGRFIGAQWDAYLRDGLWLGLASHANAMADRLAQGLERLSGVTVAYPVEANEVFVILPEALDQALRAAGAAYYPWVVPGDPAKGAMVRMVTSFATAAEDVDRFLAVAQSALGRTS